ncbi:CcdC family protein [Bacillus atrophaeus]|uniref:CcdC family protein n=1 Tax=Bacillus atrophaeus TaxID=1452 RepID=UPI00227FCD63|nr:CcdC family protein [Bacillus atrophaeus]MCY8910566.1 CcdC family protein [Bacillus atrophaeus]MEC0839319.1 CcdC family protein [Bacillus atrophaeus]MEC0847805.1 CcdC family protein [Bacillus atrophaeus]MEC0851861.1 CcdC family protein [Bacillus atrophaeus]MEC0866738.1 CcdC family protein [Bacillus atrophaeus]
MICMMIIISSIIAVLMATAVMVVRIKSSDKPVSPKKIILPPIFMSTGALMFLFPVFWVTGEEFLEAITLGVIFSIFLIKTSKFEIKNNEIYMKRSKAFVFILVGLLVIRIVMKSILSTSVDYGALSGMFWILAFGMIVPWRIAMYLSYRKLHNEMQAADIQMN